MPNDVPGASGSNSRFVDLQLIWDRNGKRIIDTETGTDLSARYGIETIIACEGGHIALRLAQGLGVETIDVRYAADESSTSRSARPVEG